MTGPLSGISLASPIAKSGASAAALQLHGGYAYTHDFPIERINRDPRTMRNYEGSSAVQRNIISGNKLV